MPQVTPSRLTMQFSWISTACPIWIAVLSAFVIGRIAPVGQTSEHLTHSGRQYPRSYDTSGCINVCRFSEGRSTWFVQTDTQSWHAVQCWEKLAALSEPGGVIGVVRFGFFLSSMMANPPSTFLSGSCTFSWAFRAAEVASNADTVKNLRRSGLFTTGWLACVSALFVFLRVYRMAPCRHLSMQSMQSTQRL